MSKRLFLILIVIVLMIIGLSPLLFMFFKSVMVDGHFSLNAYAEVLATERQWTLMRNSLILASSVALSTTLVGVPLGLLFAKTDLPFRNALATLFVIPLLIPPYIFAVSWSDLLGDLLSESGFDLLFGSPGCIFILFSTFLPIPMLLTMFFLRTIDPRLEEAGRLVTSWAGVLWGVTLPLIYRAIVLAFMLVFILSLGELSVANFLRYDVYALESFTQFAAFYDLKAATAAAFPLAFVALLFLLSEELFFHKREYGLRSFSGSEIRIIGLGRSCRWLFPAVALFGVIIVIMPLLVLVLLSGGLESYMEAFQRAGDSVLRSLLFAGIAATLLTLLGFFIGYIIHTRALKIWRLVDVTTIFLFALPGTVIGIGLISMWNTPWTNVIYATPIIIIFGLLAKYIALTSKISVVQLGKIPASMEEAAQVAGARWSRIMIYIVLPLAWRGLALAWIVGYIFSLRDTAVTMLIYPAGQDTLPIRIFTLMANGSPELIAALCVIMTVITLVPAALFWLLLKMMKVKAP